MSIFNIDSTVSTFCGLSEVMLPTAEIVSKTTGNSSSKVSAR